MGKKSPAQAAVAEAIALRLFPPSLRYPEMGADLLLSEWFGYPTLTWAPECLEPNRRPKCVIEGCCCVPKVKEYKERLVEDFDHRTVLYYARHQCAGTTKKSFSTISDAYLASSKTFVLHFSYLLTYKSGISTDMFDIVYDSMLTTKGIAGAVANISRRRQRRYYRILSRVGASVEKLRLENADYAPPLPSTEAQYIANNLCIDAEVLKELWLTHTNIYSRLCAAHMMDTKCNRVFRIDHSQKFCSKLKVYGENGSKEQSTSIRMLLLVQNEVGQIMGRSLTQSENHAETEVLLQSTVKKMGSGSDGPWICVRDNVNTTRNLIARVFGEAVEIKQDPFHVITRLTEKISDSAKKKWLAGQLSAAIYDLQRNLRPPAQCEELFKAAVESLDLSSIRVKRSEWEGCVTSNLAQIRRGDLYVAENQYTEKGGEVRVVSTSQLEAVHSKLRKLLDRVLSVEVGIKILDIFILQHNLNVGAKHRRNPVFHGTDFRSVCQSALICAGSLPDTPQLEYMRMLLSRSSKTDLATIEFRLGSAAGPQHRPWERVFDMIRLDTTQIESRLLRQHEVAGDIRELLLNAHKARKSTNSKVFVELLGLEPEYESSTEFTAREFSLLKELRAEQLAANKLWSKSDVIATIVYNAAVQQLDNPALV